MGIIFLLFGLMVFAPLPTEHARIETALAQMVESIQPTYAHLYTSNGEVFTEHIEKESGSATTTIATFSVTNATKITRIVLDNSSQTH